MTVTSFNHQAETGIPFKTMKNQQDGLVSVIIPDYNHAQYICDAIQSVLNQEYRQFEIIVVDDGSTDNSREVVAQFGDDVKYIWQENQGLSAARNTGIAVASGEYIGLLDADDIYEPDFMSELVSLMAENRGIDGVYCGYRFVDHQNNPLPQIEARTIPEGQLYQHLLDSNFLVPESMLMRKHCYSRVGSFDISLSACEDWDMWLRMSSQYNIAGTTRILTRHRILPGSMSADPQRMLDNRLAVLDKHFGRASEKTNVRNDDVKRAFGRAYLASCVEYLQFGDREKADTCLQGMANVYPALLTQLDTYYQLGCGNQPKGQMGDFASLDLEQNTELLLGMLDSLFAQKELVDKIGRYQRPSYAFACYSLALLYYGARRFPQARHFFLKALIKHPGFGLNRQFMTTLLKTLAGAKVITQLKNSKQKLA